MEGVRPKLKFDRAFFFSMLIVCLCIIGLAIYDMSIFAAFFQPIIDFVIFKLKGPIAIINVGLFAFMIWLMCSKFGDIKLGKDTDEPEYSTWTWVCMIFSAGAGFASLLWWSSEGIHHLMTSSIIEDMGLTGSPKGVPLALASGYMDWTLLAYALDILLAIAFALPAFRMGKPFSIAGGLYGVFGEKVYNSKLINKVCDYIGAFGAAGGPTASMGVGMILLSSGILHITGIEVGVTGKIIMVLCFCVAFTLSSFKGIAKGMSVLSRISVWIPMVLTAWIFVTGPTLYISDTVVQSIGALFSNFIDLSFFTDCGTFVTPEGTTELVYQPRGWQSWWLTSNMVWIAASVPFTAGFTARISRGRTIREIIFWTLSVTTVFGVVFMGIMSSAVCYAEITGTADVWAMLQTDSGSALYTILESYPLGIICAILGVFSCACLGVTTFDAATYFLAVQCSGGEKDPNPMLKVLLGGLLGFVAICFLLMGDFIALRGIGAVAGVPVVFGSVIFGVSIYNMCKDIHKRKW